MTITDKIRDGLARFAEENPKLSEAARDLNKKFDELIESVKDHLSEISLEMPEYDKHDASHSEAVLRIIEELLQEKGIRELSLLEAMVLRFCCYFHDTGMILPKFCMPLLARVEADPKADPLEGLEEWLESQDKDFDRVKELFLLPESQDAYIDFLLQALLEYRDYRLGLKSAPENMTQRDYIMTTRHDFLRKHHCSRTKSYALNLSRRFEDIIHGSEQELAKTIGNICAAHGWQFREVRELPVKLELFSSCPELSCNVRYLAMLLRMGDLLHFGPERASRTLYIEREKMNAESDLHWQAKRDTRGYRINPAAGGGVDISYHGSFTVPQEYYFVQEHMNCVDEELICYESFRRDMEKRHGETRYDLGLPEKMNREHATAREFTPDQELKFKLEHKNIIQLLMGARLYRDEFMCLRELYQNALDACRCMRAELGGTRELEIEFGLGRDAGGDYLYCRDQGTGMTMDIVKNYLLRIGNSYYQSDEFRRKNAGWGDAVAPVSEFGIGLLSCYMIADRIEIITRHYTAVEGEKPIWISMKDNDDFGYQRPTSLLQERKLGKHGTIVKLYLMEQLKPQVTGFIPDNVRDAVYLLERYNPDRQQYNTETNMMLDAFGNSLYHRVQQFVHVPEAGIPVRIKGSDRSEQLFRADMCYEKASKLSALTSWGVKQEWDTHGKTDAEYAAYLMEQDRFFVTYYCVAADPDSGASAAKIIRLPTKALDWDTMDTLGAMNEPVCSVKSSFDQFCVYIDGMPVRTNEWKGENQYSFSGSIRPRLTVDRGSIREIPPEVWENVEKLNVQLLHNVAERIRDHIRRYPEAGTEEMIAWLYHHLYTLFGLYRTIHSEDLILLIQELSLDVFRNCRTAGVNLYDWYYAEKLVLNGDARKNADLLSTIYLRNACMNASDIRIDGKQVVIRRSLAEMKSSWHPFCVVRIDGEPEIFNQYDTVSDFWGFVPERVFRLLSKGKIMGHVYGPENSYLDSVFTAYQDVWDLTHPARQDVLLYLQEPSQNRRIHRCKQKVFPRADGDRRYVVYAFISPRPLTEEEELELNAYQHIPEYIRGVREGWSVLFYNYMDGYVIAPGVVDRMEMLKQLPEEAKNHDDGLEYYFTDGTFAF